MNQYIEKLKFAIYEQEQNFLHINHAIKKLKKYMPLKEQMLDDPDIVEHIDQLIFRWIKIQDGMGKRLMPSLVELIESSTDEMTFIDKLHTLEKFDLIDVQQWNIFRSIRNNLTYIYPEDKLETLETIADAYKMISDLEKIFLKLKDFSLKHI